jgi:hypothetical protein
MKEKKKPVNMMVENKKTETNQKEQKAGRNY